MKDRNVLTLIEQATAVLILTVAAAICLKMFAHSSTIADETTAVSNATVLISNASEAIRYTSGDLQKTAMLNGWDYNDSCISYSENNLEMVITKNAEDEYLGCAKIIITSKGSEVISVDVLYQR